MKNFSHEFWLNAIDNAKTDEAKIELLKLREESQGYDYQYLTNKIDQWHEKFMKWNGLTEDEFIFFCHYTDAETVTAIETLLRTRNT